MKSGNIDQKFLAYLNKLNDRFKFQASWTAEARKYLYRLCDLDLSDRILEVGCGTCAVWEDFFQSPDGKTKIKSFKDNTKHLFGLDLRREYLHFAKSYFPESKLVQGDALELPFNSAVFRHTFCHFLLLWVKDPLTVIREMIRVTLKGGNVIIMAEPDHLARLDYPEQFEQIGRIQTESLRLQGADVQMGRKIGSLLLQAGLEEISVGLLGGNWRPSTNLDEWKSEWETFESDLAIVNLPHDLPELHQLDRVLRKKGTRVLFVPTFYAFGKVT